MDYNALEKGFFDALDKKQWDIAKSLWGKNPDKELVAEWLYRRILHDSFMGIHGESDKRYPVFKTITPIKPYLVEIWNKVVESDEERIGIIEFLQIALSERDDNKKAFPDEELGERIYLIISTMVEAQKHNFDFEKILSELKSLKNYDKLFHKNEFISKLIRLVDKLNKHDVTKISMDSTESWHYVGPKPEGSNPGAIYQGTFGANMMVKWGKSESIMGNEFLANRIYRALMLSVPEMKLVKHDGKIALASYMLNKAYNTRPDEYTKLWKGFAADAWLRNWDVVNSGNVMTSDGVVYRVDVGGSLLYRAQGAEKPGNYTDVSVSELESMRNPAMNKQAAAVFGQMTDVDIMKSIRVVLSLHPDTLKRIVDKYWIIPHERTKMVEWLEARRNTLRSILKTLLLKVDPKTRLMQTKDVHYVTAIRHLYTQLGLKGCATTGFMGIASKHADLQTQLTWFNALSPYNKELIREYKGESYILINAFFRRVKKTVLLYKNSLNSQPHRLVRLLVTSGHPEMVSSDPFFTFKTNNVSDKVYYASMLKLCETTFLQCLAKCARNLCNILYSAPRITQPIWVCRGNEWKYEKIPEIFTNNAITSTTTRHDKPWGTQRQHILLSVGTPAIFVDHVVLTLSFSSPNTNEFEIMLPPKVKFGKVLKLPDQIVLCTIPHSIHDKKETLRILIETKSLSSTHVPHNPVPHIHPKPTKIKDLYYDSDSDSDSEDESEDHSEGEDVDHGTSSAMNKHVQTTQEFVRYIQDPKSANFENITKLQLTKEQAEWFEKYMLSRRRNRDIELISQYQDEPPEYVSFFAIKNGTRIYILKYKGYDKSITMKYRMTKHATYPKLKSGSLTVYPTEDGTYVFVETYENAGDGYISIFRPVTKLQKVESVMDDHGTSWLFAIDVNKNVYVRDFNGNWKIVPPTHIYNNKLQTYYNKNEDYDKLYMTMSKDKSLKEIHGVTIY